MNIWADQYHPADIDLSSYGLDGSSQVRFSSHMRGTGDYFHIDDIVIQ